MELICTLAVVNRFFWFYNFQYKNSTLKMLLMQFLMLEMRLINQHYKCLLLTWDYSEV